MNKRIIIFIIVIIIVLTGVCIGRYLYNKPHQSAASESASTSIPADALFQEYQQNEHAADSMYLGKVIEVKGVLAEIDHNGATDILELAPQKAGGGISCQMFPHDKSTTTSYPAIGTIIRVKGKCTGFLMDVNLVDCGIK
jgi:hypothetical protein